ncbi:MAG TPA: hypothetical protein PL143_00970 [Rhodocyclaceae bacterium]|nr:hypothetical protein [Rhodocyclaceae bacterium]
MLTQDRCAFLRVRGLADLERTCRDLAGLLSALRRRGASAGTMLLGIWVDERPMAELPAMLELGEPAEASRPARIVEATGVSGVWMMYVLETLPSVVSRADVLTALLRACADPHDDPAPGRFIPVFTRDAPADSIKAALQCLESRHPGRLLAPLYQDELAGAVQLPPGPRLFSESRASRAVMH